MVYEVYESSSCVYLIMEHLYRNFDNDFTDEEIKIIVYVYFIIYLEFANIDQKIRKIVYSS